MNPNAELGRLLAGPSRATCSAQRGAAGAWRFGLTALRAVVAVGRVVVGRAAARAAQLGVAVGLDDGAQVGGVGVAAGLAVAVLAVHGGDSVWSWPSPF